MYSTGLITTFNLISTWLIVATAGTRYLATFHPIQSALEPDQCGRAGCRGVLGRYCSLLVVFVIYVVCAVGNLPSFFLFRAIPVAVLDTGIAPNDFDSNTNVSEDGSESFLTIAPTSSSAPHPFLDSFPAVDSDTISSTTTSLSASRDDDDVSNLMYIDLGAFSHDTRSGVIFHWIKSACSIFLPGLLLMFFNIRLIQAIRQSERLRQSRDDRSGSSTSAPPIDGLSGMTNSRWVASRNRLNVTLVAVIVMFVCLVYPCELLDFFVHLTPPGSPAVDREAMMLTRMFLNALQLSKFALNFFLYCTLNTLFRRALTDWFCRRSPFQRNSKNFRRTFHATPAAIPNARPCLGPRNVHDVRMAQIRGGSSIRAASSASHSAADADKFASNHANSGRSGQHQTGSHSSHSNARRS